VDTTGTIIAVSGSRYCPAGFSYKLTFGPEAANPYFGWTYSYRKRKKCNNLKILFDNFL